VKTIAERKVVEGCSTILMSLRRMGTLPVGGALIGVGAWDSNPT
jgi:hypothetical protein